MGLGPPRQRGHAAGEGKQAARAAPNLRLPVVELVPHQVEAEPQIVPQMIPTDVSGMREGLVAVKSGIPGVGGTHRRIGIEREDRKSALANVRPVGSRYAQKVRAPVLAIIGSYEIHRPACESDGTVHDQVRRKRQRMADGSKLSPHGADPTAAGTQARTSAVAESEFAVYIRVHHAVLSPDNVGGRAVPVHLRVVAVTVHRLRCLAEEIVGSAGEIRERHSVLQLARNRALTSERDPVAGERLPSRSVRIAGVRIIDHLAVSAEVAIPLIGGRHGITSEKSRALPGAFVTAEEEQLVLLDRTSDGSAVDIQNVLRLVANLEEVAGADYGVVLERKCGPVKVVGAALGGHRNSGTAGQPLLRVKRIRRDVDRLDRICGRVVQRVMRKPDVDVQRTVQPGVVAVPVRTVDVGRQRPRRC